MSAASRAFPLLLRRSAITAGVRHNRCLRGTGCAMRASSVRIARKWGFPPGVRTMSMSPASLEDCLYLNVWRPSGAPSGTKLPVMFWIYGGGFTDGSSSSSFTSGTQFAKQGVVLVAANYRVGRFGFFAFPALSKEHPDELKRNYAYMDQIAALQ